jgi:hypothetical protein
MQNQTLFQSALLSKFSGYGNILAGDTRLTCTAGTLVCRDPAVEEYNEAERLSHPEENLQP